MWFLEMNPLPQRSQLKCILKSINLHVALQVVSEDEFLVTRSMTCHVFFNMAPGYESLATQSTLIWIPPSMTFHVSHWVVPGMDYPQGGSECVSLGGSMI